MMMGFGFMGMFLFWGGLLSLLAGGVVLVLSRGSSTKSRDGRERSTARQVLDERLARGEVTRDEYQEIRAQIER